MRQSIAILTTERKETIPHFTMHLLGKKFMNEKYDPISKNVYIDANGKLASKMQIHINAVLQYGDFFQQILLGQTHCWATNAIRERKPSPTITFDAILAVASDLRKELIAVIDKGSE